MQIVFNVHKMHEMWNPVFRENYEKYFNMLSAENFTHSDKC